MGTNRRDDPSDALGLKYERDAEDEPFMRYFRLMLPFLAGLALRPKSLRYTAIHCLPSGVSSHHIGSSWR